MRSMKLFISYSRDDRSYVNSLSQEIRRNARYQLWVDEQIHVSEDWWKSILEAIEWCDCCIYIVTEKSINSVYCKAEVEYVLSLNKPIIPVMHKKTIYPHNLDKRRIQYLDATDLHNIRENYIKIVESLLEVEFNIRDGKYPSPSPLPTRPLIPQILEHRESEIVDPFELFLLAEALVEKNVLNDAEKIFKKLQIIDPEGFGKRAESRLQVLRQHQEMVHAYQKIADALEETKSSHSTIAIAWEVFQQKFGTDYDPKLLGSKFTKSVSKLTPSQYPKIAPKPGEKLEDNRGITVLYVPPGKFRMGNNTYDEDQRPEHDQIIREGFWLDLLPVTNASFDEFINDGGYERQEFWTPSGWTWREKSNRTSPENYDGFGEPSHPRVGVSWFEAVAYAAWRNGRLPSEAEWEWAARGPDNNIYPWGNDFETNYVVWQKNSNNRSALVGPNIRVEGRSWIGVHDMSGNVWEWTSSIYKPYPYKGNDGRENLNASHSLRTLRGGSWFVNGISLLRSDFRLNSKPELSYFNRGFRIVSLEPT